MATVTTEDLKRARRLICVGEADETCPRVGNNEECEKGCFRLVRIERTAQALADERERCLAEVKRHLLNNTAGMHSPEVHATLERVRNLMIGKMRSLSGVASGEGKP